MILFMIYIYIYIYINSVEDPKSIMVGSLVSWFVDFMLYKPL